MLIPGKIRRYKSCKGTAMAGPEGIPSGPAAFLIFGLFFTEKMFF
jgi:hypothetical protein